MYKIVLTRYYKYIYQTVPELQQCALHDDKYIYVQYE